MSSPSTTMVVGLPLWWLLSGGLLFWIVAFFSESLYRMDLNAIYGRKIKKLEETLKEMEELRNAPS